MNFDNKIEDLYSELCAELEKIENKIEKKALSLEKLEGQRSALRSKVSALKSICPEKTSTTPDNSDDIQIDDKIDLDEVLEYLQKGAVSLYYEKKDGSCELSKQQRLQFKVKTITEEEKSLSMI